MTEERQDGGPPLIVPVKCAAEEKQPDLDWPETWHRARQKGLTNDARSFLFLLLNDLLPTKERLHKTTRNTPSPVCVMCQSGETDSAVHHTFSGCAYSSVVMNWLVITVNQQALSHNVSSADIVKLQFETMNSDDTLAITWLFAESLAYVWARRQNRQDLVLMPLKMKLMNKVGFLVKSAKYSVAGNTLKQMIEND